MYTRRRRTKGTGIDTVCLLLHLGKKLRCVAGASYYSVWGLIDHPDALVCTVAHDKVTVSPEDRT